MNLKCEPIPKKINFQWWRLFDCFHQDSMQRLSAYIALFLPMLRWAAFVRWQQQANVFLHLLLLARQPQKLLSSGDRMIDCVAKELDRNWKQRCRFDGRKCSSSHRTHSANPFVLKVHWQNLRAMRHQGTSRSLGLQAPPLVHVSVLSQVQQYIFALCVFLKLPRFKLATENMISGFRAISFSSFRGTDGQPQNTKTDKRIPNNMIHQYFMMCPK